MLVFGGVHQRIGWPKLFQRPVKFTRSCFELNWNPCQGQGLSIFRGARKHHPTEKVLQFPKSGHGRSNDSGSTIHYEFGCFNFFGIGIMRRTNVKMSEWTRSKLLPHCLQCWALNICHFVLSNNKWRHGFGNFWRLLGPFFFLVQQKKGGFRQAVYRLQDTNTKVSLDSVRPALKTSERLPDDLRRWVCCSYVVATVATSQIFPVGVYIIILLVAQCYLAKNGGINSTFWAFYIEMEAL